MQIGAIGMSFQPYIYNTNTVSANSLNKISAIEDDALKSSVDYSSSRNENPLKTGQTIHFADVLAMQIQLGQNNAARIMKPAADAQEADSTEQSVQTAKAVTDPAGEQQIEQQITAVQEAEDGAAAAFDPAFSQEGISSYRMSRAIDAYRMAMAG